MVQPHIITLAETKLQSKPPILKNYSWLTKNRQNREGGGVAILIRNDIAPKTTKVTNIEDQNQEILWIEIKNHKKPTYIGVYYGPQENTPSDEIERQYSQLLTQIIKLKYKGHIILTGDFNAKLQLNTTNIKQNETTNGRHLNELLKNTGLIPISINNKYLNWTRENRNNPQEKSVIDYILVDKETNHRIKNLTIDNKTNLLKGKSTTDHNTIIIETHFQINPQKESIKKWNLRNNDNWKNFNQKLVEKMKDIKTPSYNDLEKSIKSTMSETLGKITIRKNKTYFPKDQQSKLLKNEVKQLRKTLRKVTKNAPHYKQEYLHKYLEKQKTLRNHLENQLKTTIENNIKTIIKEGGTKSQKFWNIRKKILKNTHQDQYNLITEEGHTITNCEQAKEYIADYYENLYTAREGTEKYQEWTSHISDIVQSVAKYKSHQNTTNIKITMKELNTAIQKLKSKKAPGPDDIPNEILIHADEQVKKIIINQFNEITETQKIPHQWQHSNIVRIYKGKGIKGKCSNERGITLASNIGKTFERIINNRITKQIIVTDAQAGGIKGRSTAEHIMILNELLKIPPTKKPKYITFLDVTKAFDKAWADAIMYTMYKNGCQDQNWLTTKNINENLTAQIKTNNGPTRKININNSIRQGGVLSGTQYSLLMDEINKEIKSYNLGIQLPKTQTKIPTLLWMDDVALISESSEDMQKMLDITNHVANKYHIEFGQSKSETLTIGSKPQHVESEKFNIGTLLLNNTTKYKYLGITLNNKMNLTDHSKIMKSKVEAAYQTVLTILQDHNFKAIQMKTAWKLIKTCIAPIITHNLEAININKGDLQELNRIWENIIKRTINTPTTTPREALYIETGLLDITTQIEQNRLRMAAKLLNTNIKILQDLQEENIKNGWWKRTNEIMTKHNIVPTQLRDKKSTTQRIIKQQTLKTFYTEINQKAQEKSKVKYCLEGIATWYPEKPQEYINNLTRATASILFQARTRMIKIKNNYRNAHNNIHCRMCKTHQETQEHILEHCPTIHNTENLKTPKHELFNTNTNKMKNTAQNLMKILNLLSETPMNH